jgi:hypothetical protein
MRFLKALWRLFAGSRGEAQWNEAPELTATEPLSRFLTSERSHFNRTKGVVKKSAYMPARDGETSTFRTEGLAPPQIWAIAEEFVAASLAKPVLGRGETTVADVTAVGLTVNPDNDPPRHAGIRGWPEEKHEKMVLAQELAKVATLRLRETERL